MAGLVSNDLRAVAFGCVSLGLCAQLSGATGQPATSQSPQAHAAPINACALLSSAEVSAVVGLAVDGGVRRDEGFQTNGSYSSACLWTVHRKDAKPADPSAPLGGKSFVILNAIRWPAGSDLARKYLEDFREASANGIIPGKPVARSFGDEALWWGDGLAVRKGDVSFGVSVFLPGAMPAQRGKLEEELAPHILQRLEHDAP